jgi:hypothetical protein
MKIDRPLSGGAAENPLGATDASSLSGNDPILLGDSVERFDKLLNLYDNFLNVAAAPQGASDIDATQYNTQLLNNLQMDADTRMQQAQLSGATGSWGSSLRDLSQEGLKAGLKAGENALKLKDDSANQLVNDQLSDHEGKKGLGETGNNLSNLGKWGKGTTLAEGEWHALEIGGVDYKDSGDWGSFSAKGAVDFLRVQGRVYGDAGFKDWSVNASIGVQGRVELVGAHYEISYTTPSIYNLGGHEINLTTKVNADASVGVQGGAEAGITLGKNNEIKLGAEGFAGASASLAGSVGVSDYGNVSGGATVWAGVGAKWEADVGFKDGKFSFNWGAGLALGLGLEVDLGFTIDFFAIGDSLYNAAADTWDAVADAGEWVEGAASDVADAVGDAAQAVGDAAESAVDAVGDAAEDVADAVGGAAEDAWDTVSDW